LLIPPALILGLVFKHLLPALGQCVLRLLLLGLAYGVEALVERREVDQRVSGILTAERDVIACH
ncbi:MAG: hypothetical protein KDK08_24605, partial [Rhizobiaceae bacterium]|nr:hypothetical protein [Rhizobiaceae bacterium]